MRAMVCVITAIAGGCRGAPRPEVAEEAPAADGAPAALRSVRYTWDPQAGDPSVAADLGGPGFTGEGWTTRAELAQLGDPTAPQGGTFVTDIADWPATFRAYGPYANTAVNLALSHLVYQTLLELDPVTGEFAPGLATHWWIADDHRTFRFRLNPAARWSDGAEVTAQDVVATFRLVTDPTLLDPTANLAFERMEAPVALSKYVVEVKAKEDRWTNFHAFATDLFVLPAAEIGGLTGSDYLDRYAFAFTAGTGPYRVADVATGASLTLTRRRDWWMEADPSKDGWFNFDRVQLVVVKDAPLAFEKAKAGELDYFVVPRAQWWAEDVPPLDAVQRGLLVPHKFYNEVAPGFAGVAMNARRPPLDDARIRRALQMLFDRQTMIEKMLYREYEALASYFPNSPYANPRNELVPYDVAGAVRLLEEAGFTEVSPDGVRSRGGEPLALRLSYSTAAAERFLTLFQESCRRAGIRVELELRPGAAGWKALTEKQYTLHYVQWSGASFPDPATMWHSSLASLPDNSNVTGYANPRVDALLDRYAREYDVRARATLLQEVDGLLAADHPYVLTWIPAAQRVLYWNRFGMPPWGTARTGVWAQNETLWALWWVDPERDRAVARGRGDPTVTMEQRPRETRFWPEWSRP